jgi:LuxR family maltose regulon positive regulatory protein
MVEKRLSTGGRPGEVLVHSRGDRSPLTSFDMTEPAPPASFSLRFRQHVRRPRLTQLLDASTARSQALVIAAPAGYGKTVLAAEWLENKPRVAWYQATTASADVAAFSVGLAEVMQPVLPGVGARLSRRISLRESPAKAAQPLAELLAGDLAAWPDDAWLVIDDYHLVADSTPVEEFVDWMLTLSPVRLLVTTRRRPGWASARRLLYGEIAEIGADQLAMRNEEARRVLAARSTEAARALVAQAQGWPALIGLAALVASSDAPRARVSDALFRYFAEEVLRQEGPEVQRFMMFAAVPPSLDARVIRRLLDGGHPEELVEPLVDKGLLRESSDGTLRFHPLLRDFLRQRLERERPELLRELSATIVADARRNRSWEDAFEVAVGASDLDLGATIVGESAPELLAAGRVETLEKWLSTCGLAALQVPEAVLARADVLTRQGRLEEASAIARDLAERLPDDDPRTSRAWYLAGRAIHLVSGEEQALEDQLRARDTARTSDDLRNALWGAFLAAAELERGDADLYLDELEKLAKDDLDTRLRIPVGRMISARNRGTLRGIWPLFEATVPLAELANDPMAQSSFWATSVYVNVRRGEYRLAKALALEAYRVCAELHVDFAMGVCLVYRATAEIGLREFAAAARSIEELAGIAGRHQDPALRDGETLTRLRLALAQGESVRAVEHVATVDGEGPLRAVHAELLGLASIAHAASGDLDQARALAAKTRQGSGGVDARFLSRFAELIADVREDVVEWSTAAHLVCEAAEAEDLDTLVVAYRACPAVLSVSSRDGAAATVVKRALRLANDAALASAAGIALPARTRSRTAAGLTRREAEVLELMAEGLSNAEIAERLVISLSTAKLHVHHVLEKLGAKRRVQAVMFAQRDRS